ncbi:HNH endonuclease [Haloferax volcanii]|uniref:HNH endonuclease n=3 Tax=Haloferax volcanii TaxID=2246 RepID=D4GX75_HALVD|nr:HNH endonuclease signature motif containing protein [Haloferax volcanii]ADE02714.1 uncharacterized protein HVO_2824 [Haloferax volcanii DS2]ELY25154.1 hypothetical protein C498_17303 [Haloferax volcanii DS2]MBS8121208.1 HNH endonuclease [Haloferax volcanii]MBS8126217.1 HNH endonuclease [Haloferax volcanii]MBS8130087.1 HNH endonuclease [Haloferax volcanii]
MSRSDGYRTFPTSVRREILKRDDFQCQVCGRLGPERGGNIDLEAHHMREDPEYVYRDHADNGTTMCIPCHHLITHRTTADDLLFALDDVAAEVNLLYKDIEILVYLYEHGPATTSEIREATSGSARTSIIERLWTLMSVDRDVDSLDGPLIDKDLDTDEWGYPDDIGRTVRGRVPEGEEELVNRLRDELLRRLLDAGVNRSTLALFFGRSRRATFYIAKRAGAIRVPFDDESHPDALMDEDEFDRVVDGMERLFRGSDRSR